MELITGVTPIYHTKHMALQGGIRRLPDGLYEPYAAMIASGVDTRAAREVVYKPQSSLLAARLLLNMYIPRLAGLLTALESGDDAAGCVEAV